MRTILYRDTFYEICRRCGLSPIDRLGHHVRFQCPVCQNGKLRPDDANGHFIEGVHRGPRF
jgi:predicted RNA-binding Zn-ribbon protein involved in translation (DUF1610 family)